MGSIECRELKIKFGAWDSDFSCSFEEGSWHVICGGSGSGKSTLFQLMLGLLAPSSGDVFMDGKSVISYAPYERQMSFMAQYNILLPHLSVGDNLLLALHDSDLLTEQRVSKVKEVLESLKLDSSYFKRMPHELSGGQLSRCNLARALLRPSRWILLDEPFAAVDRPTRLSILEWLKNWQEKTGSGILLVSHDLDDVFNVATHVTVIAKGRILENQTLSSSINEPKCQTTATLLRSGAILRRNDSLVFVNSANLYLSPTQDGLNTDFSETIELPKARVVRVGNSFRIIDLTSGIDVTLPSIGDFHGRLWFDHRFIKKLDES